MIRAFILATIAACIAGCWGYEDPRPDPTTQPGFVDTSDPSVVLGQQRKEIDDRKEKAKERRGKK